MLTLTRVLAKSVTAACLVSALVAPLALAQTTTETVAFQGRLKGPGGTSLSDGLYRIRFSIYSEESGGSALWTENQPSVQVTDGLSNTILFGENPAPPEIFTDWSSLWLEITVDSDNDGFEPEEVFSPRTALNAVPIALYSKDSGALGGAPAADYALKTDVDSSIGILSTEIDNELAAQDVDIAAKADADTVNSALATKADSTEVQTALADKADIKDLFQWQVVVSGGLVPAERNTGYVLTTNEDVQVQLPESASLGVGDIVRISNAGTGSWSILQGAGQYVLSQNLVSSSYRSASWEPRETTRIWSDIAMSSDGRYIYAVDGGTPGPVMKSVDGGLTWTQVFNNSYWRAVATSSDGSVVTVVDGGPGNIWTSTDYGLNWFFGDSSRTWSDVACSADGVKQVATVNFGGKIYTSTNSGATWTPRDNDRDWTSVASSADGVKLVAAVSPGLLYTSTDSGENWVSRAISQQWRAVASTPDGTKLAAVAYGGQIYTSTNSGVTWTARDVNRNWTGIAISADGNRLAATVYGGAIYISNDEGINWEPTISGINWRSVAMTPDGNKLVAAPENAPLYTATPTAAPIGRATTVGTSGGLRGGQHSAVELQYVGNDAFLPLSASSNLGAI